MQIGRIEYAPTAIQQGKLTMVQTLPAEQVTLQDLTDNFGLQFIEDEQFFREWQDNLPEITFVPQLNLQFRFS